MMSRMFIMLRWTTDQAVGSTPGRLGEIMKADLARWGPLVREAGARND